MENNNNNSNLICNGEFEIVKITEDLYDEAIYIYQNYFVKCENVCTATNLAASQQSVDEMLMLIRPILKQGVSFAARNCATRELAAICINIIINPKGHCTMDDVFHEFRSPAMIFIGGYLEHMEFSVDLYKEWNIDCVLEIEFLSTRPVYGGRGLATILCKHSIEYAKKMLEGTLPESEGLPAHIRVQRPQAVCSVFTSRFTQIIGEKLGFQTIYKAKMSDFKYEGIPLSEKIDPIHEYTVFAALRL